MTDNRCKICESLNNTKEYILKEMMYGTMDEFKYFMCNDCGCLQIKNFPSNIEKYYPSDYYSYVNSKNSGLLSYLKFKRDLYSYNHKDIIGRVLSHFVGYSDFYTWIGEINIDMNDKILDVGTGAGDLLFRLQKIGFRNLLGIDQYIKNDILTNNELKILKKNLTQIDNKFDLVMFNHSFEHMDNPHEVFIKLKEIVKEGKFALIRIPVIDCYAWEFYHTDWVQLDPPRHYFLYSKKSIEYLASKYDFAIKNIIYDSTAFQFWGSEQYKRQIPLLSRESYSKNKKHSIFSAKEIRKFKKHAIELNRANNGDSACFILQKK